MEIKPPDALFARLLRSASLRANELLSVPGGAARVRVIADDGYNDQLVAVALRLSDACRGAGQPLVARMAQYFHIPAPSIEVEALRRSIWSEQERAGLPLDEARREVATIESRMIDGERSRRSELRAYAALYSDLWCDPRTAAPSATRRMMLAMVTGFAERSNASSVSSGRLETVS